MVLRAVLLLMRFTQGKQPSWAGCLLSRHKDGGLIAAPGEQHRFASDGFPRGTCDPQRSTGCRITTLGYLVYKVPCSSYTSLIRLLVHNLIHAFYRNTVVSGKTGSIPAVGSLQADFRVSRLALEVPEVLRNGVGKIPIRWWSPSK